MVTRGRQYHGYFTNYQWDEQLTKLGSDMDAVVQRLEIVEATLTELKGTRATGRTKSAITELDPQTFGTGPQTRSVTPAPQASRTRAQMNLVTPGP